jgi:hypothetical protein
VLLFPEKDIAKRFDKIYDQSEIQVPARNFVMSCFAPEVTEADSNPVATTNILPADSLAPAEPKLMLGGALRYEVVYTGFPDNFTVADLQEALTSSDIPEELQPDVDPGFIVTFKTHTQAIQFRDMFHGCKPVVPPGRCFRISVGF